MNIDFNKLGLSTQSIVSNFKLNWIIIIAVVVVVVLVFTIIRIISKRINRIIDKKIGPDKIDIKKRSFTFNNVVTQLITALSIFAGVMIIAGQLGISILPIVTGAGVIGLVLGLSAQSLIKDIINGGFILFEQWFQVDDIISVGNVSGTVERFNLRSTVIRDINGTVHHIPNSEIKILSNMTSEWARAVIDIGVHYSEKTGRVIEVLNTVFDEIYNDKIYKDYIVEKPQILGDDGISSLDENAVVFKIICKVKPPNQWTIERQLRKRIKDRFDEEGIEMPYPCRNIYMR